MSDKAKEIIKDPRYRALQTELMGMNTRLDALISIWRPKTFIFDVVPPITKAAAFADTRIECLHADLIRISTDGDLTDISYKIIQMDGHTTQVIQAAETPQFPGPIAAILLTNNMAEAGRFIRIARVHGNVSALAAMPHGTPSATTIKASGRMFYAELVEYAVGADNFFEADQAMGDIPTLHFDGLPAVLHLRINTIKHQMNPTAAVTYQLYLLERASGDDEQQESDIIFDSGVGMVGGTIYMVVPGGAPARLPVDVRLDDPGEIWYMLDWSAAPGNTGGYIKIYGEVIG